MSDLPPDAAPAASPRTPNWRDRYDASRGPGTPLDPRSEPVKGIDPYPTEYARDHLLITARAEELDDLITALEDAARDFGWVVELRNIDDTPLDRDTARERARRWRERLDLPTVYRMNIDLPDSEDRPQYPIPPIDAWRLLQRLRARTRNKEIRGVSLDHVLSVRPYGSKTTKPYGSKTTVFGIRTNTPGPESYTMPGSGGKQVVTYVGPAPASRYELAGGRRPVVAVLDTGCGDHPWLTDDVVTRYPTFEGKVIGIADEDTDPEVKGDVSGPFDGELDAAAGHGTFIAGIIRQQCPDARILSVRVADSQGDVLEGTFMYAVRMLVQSMATPDTEGGRKIDVLNLSLGYYHETPADKQFDRTLNELLVAARRHGCAVVCSAGNESTDRPSFPAALWRWKDADFVVDDPFDAAPHISVGALNPNNTMALFSNLGEWVHTYAPGAAVVSTQPSFNGGVQPGTRDNRDGYRRETIDPEDFSGGFAVWSGTSFAAPYVAGALAEGIAKGLMDGSLADDDRCEVLRAVADQVRGELSRRGPLKE